MEETTRRNLWPVALARQAGCPVSPNKCEGSNCMAWRWFEAETGFCGLAGRPETISDVAKIGADAVREATR